MLGSSRWQKLDKIGIKILTESYLYCGRFVKKEADLTIKLR